MIDAKQQQGLQMEDERFDELKIAAEKMIAGIDEAIEAIDRMIAGCE